MDLGLNGKVAVVAAASDGLGKAVATAFAREGASVAICGRTTEKVERAAAEIGQETGARVLAVTADVSKAEDVARFVTEAATALGRIDTLVCNAGGPPALPFVKLDDAHWDLAVQLNLMSVVRLIRAALPHLKASGCGRIDTERIRNLDKGRAAKAGIAMEEQRTRTEREISLRRYGTPAEFAQVAVFLGSPANSYVTGQALLVDGGLTRAL